MKTYRKHIVPKGGQTFDTAALYSTDCARDDSGIKMKYTTLYIALLGLLMMPISQAEASDNTFWGTGIGAALGGYIGSTIGKGRGNLTATAAGVFIGGALGNSVGHSMDRVHHRTYAVQQATYYAPPHRRYRPNYVAPIATQNSTILYPNKRSPSPYDPPRLKRVERGYMDDRPHNRRHKGRQCREFTQTVRIDGQIKESYGMACLRPDGSWQVQ